MSLSIVRAYFEAYNQRRWVDMVALCHPDVVHDRNESGRELGAQALLDYLEQMAACYDEELCEVELLAGSHGRFAAEWVADGRYIADDAGLLPAKGQHYRVAGGTFFQIDGGHIVRITTYYNLQSFLDQIV